MQTPYFPLLRQINQTIKHRKISILVFALDSFTINIFKYFNDLTHSFAILDIHSHLYCCLLEVYLR